MSPRTGKLVQYGKRSSTANQSPPSVEPVPKRRKLSASQSSPDISRSTESTPARNPLSATLSLPSVIATSPQPRQRPPSPPSPSPSVSKPHLRTYSQSRSFLVALPPGLASQEISSAETPLSVVDSPSLEPDDDVRESYTDLRTRWGVDHSEDDPRHVPGANNDLMSITELRSKGESRRFLDEVGYLFEGLEVPGMAASVQRSSASEIVLKMCDSEFMRKAKAADFISHAWDAMTHVAKSNDKVLDPYLAFFVALVARDKRDVDDLGHKNGFFDVVLRLLQTRSEEDGLAAIGDVHTASSKTERIAFANLRNTIVNRSDLLASSVPSTRLLASHALSRTPPSLYPDEMLPVVLQSLLTELALLRPRLDAYTSGFALLPAKTHGIPDLEHIDYCLRIIDAFLLGSWSPSIGTATLDVERENLAAGLVALCIVISILNAETKRRHTTCCMESNLRVLINISHLSVEWCQLLIVGPSDFLTFLVREILSQSHWPEEEEVGELEDKAGYIQKDSLDRQCLALALLSNLVLAIDETKRHLRDVVLNPSCCGGRRCAFSCRCPVRLNAIECLVSFFVETNIKSESSSTPELDFFRCHLAALVCLLTFEDPVNQDIVQRALSGVDSRAKTKSISDSVQLFLEFYTEAPGHAEFGMSNSGVDMAARVASAFEALCT
ncbi:hypothetical protein JB92DRAFT_3138865 [Gautieria morchelliformis]|nr:hypothetical protein JB92DRAFT_3138865 [Gautieria morchelliformis]